MWPSKGERDQVRGVSRTKVRIGLDLWLSVLRLEVGERSDGGPVLRTRSTSWSHSTALAKRMNVVPSASAWCIRQITALRPSDSSGSTSMRQSGSERSSRCSNRRATFARRPASSSRPPPSWTTTCRSRSTVAAEPHHGSPSTLCRRRRSSGPRSRRDAIDAVSRSGSISPSSTMTLQVCPATVSFSRLRMSRSSDESRPTSRSTGREPGHGLASKVILIAAR
jgi:hypothetical protein